ncbi:MAG: cobalamin biosynthesis protein [Rhodobacteraceae bacterium]|nr:cobalamin biosynthesis protein [Paracoccaceae bacterium]
MIVAGMGFRQSASLAALRDAFARAGGGSAQAIATAEDKAGAPTFRAFAAECGLPIHSVPMADLAGQPVQTQSTRVAALYGTGSLAEAAALAAAGPGARLLAPRVTSQDGTATAALAERKSE